MKITNKRVFGVFRNQNIGFKYIYIHIYKYKEHLGTSTLQGRCLVEIIVLQIYSEASCLFIAFKVPPLQRWEAPQCDCLFMCIPHAMQNDVIA